MNKTPEVSYLASKIQSPARIGIDSALVVAVAVYYPDGSADSVAECRWLASKDGTVTLSKSPLYVKFNPEQLTARGVRSGVQALLERARAEVGLWAASYGVDMLSLPEDQGWDIAAGEQEVRRSILFEAAGLQDNFGKVRAEAKTGKLSSLFGMP